MKTEAIERALDSFSCNVWVKVLIKLYLIGQPLIHGRHQRQCGVSRLRRQLEMSDTSFWFLTASVVSLVAGFMWLGIIRSPYILGVSVLALALLPRLLKGIVRARIELRSKIMGLEEELLKLGMEVSCNRPMGPISDRVLTFLEARRVGEEARKPSTRELVIFTYAMLYATYQGRPQNCHS